MKKTFKIAAIPGDGIGHEVLPEGIRVLQAVAEKWDLRLSFEHFEWASCDYYLKHGKMMPDDWFNQLIQFDAIYFGAVGWPETVPDHISLWGSLLKFRRDFQQYVNLRPVRLLLGVPCPLANKKPEDIDFYVVRENTEGEYSTIGGRLYEGTEHEIVIQGVLGRLIDMTFLIATVGALTISLVVTASTLSGGISVLIGIPNNFMVQAGITLLAALIFSLSSYIGIDNGMRRLSQMVGWGALGFAFLVLIAGPTEFTINNIIHAVGLTTQNFLQMSLFTDPMGDGQFTRSWTVFYWLWWISYTPGVASFHGFWLWPCTMYNVTPIRGMMTVIYEFPVDAETTLQHYDIYFTNEDLTQEQKDLIKLPLSEKNILVVDRHLCTKKWLLAINLLFLNQIIYSH
ncbi:Leu2p [Xenorhabdus indica]|nr:Leu2p [Xenorhabdus indica]